MYLLAVRMRSVAQCDLSEDATLQTVSIPGRDPVPRDPSCWTYYHKPIFILIISGLALSSGLVVILSSSGLFGSNFRETIPVNDEVGPLCLSIGLMFAVLGVVWTLIKKENVKHKRPMI